MILLDSNILIYSAQPSFAHLRPLVSDPLNAVSAFTVLEVLGFPALAPGDKVYFETAFKVLQVFEINQPILSQAIKLRQTRKMTPGDAIIAATALVHGYEIYTRNKADFNWIAGLRVVNPIP
jgi:predicted nucleic acid-binding protein